MTSGSGGVGIVHVAMPWWVVVPVLLVVAFGTWKLVKFLWSMLGS